MARIMGEIKPDWSVVRYETKKDFEQLKEQGRIYDLCRGLITFDSENYDINNSISYFTVRINLDNSSAKIAIKISPDLLDLPGLEKVVEKINRRFVDDVWRGFSNYDTMVQTVAKDYNEWMQYAREKRAWDSEQIWSPTDAGYNLVFPIWRDVKKIISQK